MKNSSDKILYENVNDLISSDSNHSTVIDKTLGKTDILDETVSNTLFSSQLKALNLKNANRLLIGHININSIRNKFEALVDGVNQNLDILLISETKLDNSFPAAQFMIKNNSTTL